MRRDVLGLYEQSVRRNRLLGTSLIVAAALCILALKAAGVRPGSVQPTVEGRTAGLSEAEPAGDVPSVGGATGNAADGEPYPSEPMQQVEWALRHHRPALLLFHSTLCRLCRMMDALVQLVRRDFEPEVVFIDVIVDDPANEEVVRWSNGGSIPAFLFLSGTGEVKRIIGPMTQAALRQELAALMVGSPVQLDIPARAR